MTNNLVILTVTTPHGNVLSYAVSQATANRLITGWADMIQEFGSLHITVSEVSKS